MQANPSHFSAEAAQAVLFDMDGVLIDSEPIYAQVMAQAAQELGVEFTHAHHARAIGSTSAGLASLIRELFGDDFPVEAFRLRWIALFAERATQHGVPRKAGVIEMLDRLDTLRVPYAIATSTPQAKAIRYLRLAGIDPTRFRAVVGGDQVAQGKPAPDIYLKAAGTTGIAATRCMVIEDSENGCNAGLAAGAHVVLVPDMRPAMAALAARVHAVLPSMQAVHAHYFGT
jgi:HAD superfamily hydrolase (TIGR01509 family)